MNWYKKANLWDDIRKFGPKSEIPTDINDPRVEWLANEYEKPKQYILDSFKSSKFKFMNDFYNRDYFTNQYGWSVPDEKAIGRLKSFVGSDTVLEVGSGHGMWAKLMQEAGINVRPTDAHSSPEAKGYLGRSKEQFFTDVEDLSGVEAIQKYGDATVLMMSWPPYDTPFAFNVLSRFGGNKLIFIGEREGGCTADSKFFELLNEQWKYIERVEIPQWEGIHDGLYLYERK